MPKHLTRSAFISLLTAASFATPTLAQVSTATGQQIARAVTDFSSNACYGIAAGTTVLPNDQSPDALSQTIHAVEKMGLMFGVNDKMLEDLGTLGQTLVSRSTMGSKSLDHGDVVVTFGGTQPGCRVILLAEAPVNVTDAISSNLANVGWKAVPAMTAQRGALERRAFVKRDTQGNPYLMNLMIIGDPSLKIRLVTTTVRIPAGVALPPGF